MDKNKQKMITIKLIDHYDVWGNNKDGYEVNDSVSSYFQTSEKNLETEKNIIQWLKKEGVLKKTSKQKTFMFEWMDDTIVDIFVRKNRYPLITIYFE